MTKDQARLEDCPMQGGGGPWKIQLAVKKLKYIFSKLCDNANC